MANQLKIMQISRWMLEDEFTRTRLGKPCKFIIHVPTAEFHYKQKPNE